MSINVQVTQPENVGLTIETGSSINVAIRGLHNALAGLQGGSNTERFHLTQSEVNLIHQNSTDIDTISGLLPSNTLTNIVFQTGNQDISGLKDFQTRPTVVDIPVLLSGEPVDLIHLYGKNDQGSTLYKGQPVYIHSANGNNPLIQIASNTGERTSSKTIGLLAQDLSINQFGYIVTEGILEGFDTDSGADGDPMWLGPSGNIIYGFANKPYGNNHLVYLGIVLRSNQNNGKAYVKVQNGFEIDELHQVYAKNPSNKDTLVYNSSSGSWFSRQLNTGDISEINNYLLKSSTGDFYPASNPSGFITGVDYIDEISGLNDVNIANVISGQALVYNNASSKWENQSLNYLPISGGTLTGNTAINGNFTVDSNVLFVDSANNRVGVGTTIPSSSLEIFGTTNLLKITHSLSDAIFLNRTNSVYNGFGFQNNGGEKWFIGQKSLSENLVFRANATNDIFAIDNAAPANTLWINNGGNVGVGTTAPNERLTVSGNIITSGNINATGTVNGTNLVYNTGDQSIAGNKTFSNNIVANGTSNRLPNQVVSTDDSIVTRKGLRSLIGYQSIDLLRSNWATQASTGSIGLSQNVYGLLITAGSTTNSGQITVTARNPANSGPEPFLGNVIPSSFNGISFASPIMINLSIRNGGAGWSPTGQAGAIAIGAWDTSPSADITSLYSSGNSNASRGYMTLLLRSGNTYLVTQRGNSPIVTSSILDTYPSGLFKKDYSILIENSSGYLYNGSTLLGTVSGAPNGAVNGTLGIYANCSSFGSVSSTQARFYINNLNATWE